MPVSQVPSLSTPATDPLRNFKFVVTFQPQTGVSVQAGFMTVGGFSLVVDTIAYRQSGYNVSTQKMPGQADFGPLVFTRGVTTGAQFMIQWMQEIFSVIQGTGDVTGWGDFRMNALLEVMDHPSTGPTATVKAVFAIYQAWPAQLTYSDFDAGADQCLISQMTLANTGWTPAVAAGATGDAPGATPSATTLGL
jgi:phage tail-like protein